ncbi:MAG: hypothetical protein WA869_36550, partial [Alloacidobacterium sp.]
PHSFGDAFGPDLLHAQMVVGHRSNLSYPQGEHGTSAMTARTLLRGPISAVDGRRNRSSGLVRRKPPRGERRRNCSRSRGQPHEQFSLFQTTRSGPRH